MSKISAFNKIDLHVNVLETLTNPPPVVGLSGLEWQKCCYTQCVQKQTLHEWWNNLVHFNHNEEVQHDEH